MSKEMDEKYLTKLVLKCFIETEIEDSGNNDTVTKQCIEWLQNKSENYYVERYKSLIYGNYNLLFYMVYDIVREIKFRHSCTFGLNINGRVI
jgi:hypothetical protein